MPLYWNRQGAVCCGKHAPTPGSDTWLNEGWRKVTEADRSGIKRFGFLGCEVGHFGSKADCGELAQ